MNFLAAFRSLLHKALHGPRIENDMIENDMEEELRSHVQHRADHLLREGLNPAEAQRRARIEFGGLQRFKEECREAAGSNFFETLGQDLRFSSRVLRKSPGFTIAAVSTLALAIGANAVVFGVLNALILPPLSVPQAQSLYSIQRTSSHFPSQSYPDYLDLRDRTAALLVSPPGVSLPLVWTRAKARPASGSS